MTKGYWVTPGNVCCHCSWGRGVTTGGAQHTPHAGLAPRTGDYYSSNQLESSHPDPAGRPTQAHVPTSEQTVQGPCSARPGLQTPGSAGVLPRPRGTETVTALTGWTQESTLPWWGESPPETHRHPAHRGSSRGAAWPRLRGCLFVEAVPFLSRVRSRRKQNPPSAGRHYFSGSSPLLCRTLWAHSCPTEAVLALGAPDHAGPSRA